MKILTVAVVVGDSDCRGWQTSLDPLVGDKLDVKSPTRFTWLLANVTVSWKKKSLPQCHATARESVNQHRQQKRVFKIFSVSMHDVYWYYGRFALLFKYCKGSNVKSKRIHFSRMRTAAAVVATRYQYQEDVWCNFLSGPMFLPGGLPLQGVGGCLPPEGLPPPCEQNDWQTPLKTLPSLAVHNDWLLMIERLRCLYNTCRGKRKGKKRFCKARRFLFTQPDLTIWLMFPF